jgi:hypothetical protein
MRLAADVSPVLPSLAQSFREASSSLDAISRQSKEAEVRVHGVLERVRWLFHCDASPQPAADLSTVLRSRAASRS